MKFEGNEKSGHTCTLIMLVNTTLFIMKSKKLHVNFPYHMLQALHNRCQNVKNKHESKVVCYIILVCKKGALGPSYRPYNNAKISMTFSKEKL